MPKRGDGMPRKDGGTSGLREVNRAIVILEQIIVMKKSNLEKLEANSAELDSVAVHPVVPIEGAIVKPVVGCK
jgi:hypothetical protein